MTSTGDPSKQTNANVRRLLSSIRWRIRCLVLLEGIALAFIGITILFWLSLAADYLPVKFGFQELSTSARATILIVSGLILLAIFYSTILKRIFVSLHDRSMALLVEKKYPQFSESLITTVEFEADRNLDNENASLLKLSREKANRLAAEVDVKGVLNDSHVRRYGYGALAGLLSLIVFAALVPSSLQTAFSRLYLLDQQLWTRESHLQWVALKAEYDSPATGIAEFNQSISQNQSSDQQSFDRQLTTFRVAKGSSLNLTVKARSSEELANQSTDSTPPKKLPRSCKLHFETEDGNFGSQTLNKVGGHRDGWQLYRLQGAPLAAMTNDLSFSIFGGDYRLGPYKISVVDEPIVSETELDCVFPLYMQDENSLRGSARTIPWTGKTELPFATSINIRVSCSKPLRKVYAVDSSSSDEQDSDEEEQDRETEHQLAEITESGFQFPIESLTEPTTIQFYLVDTDGVIAQSPHTVSLSPISDQPPTIEASLVGIGSAITPSAVLTIQGTVDDDYDVDAVWLEIQTPVTDTLTKDIDVLSGGKIRAEFDFQEMALKEDGFALPTSGAEISFVIKASDRFDLGEGPNIGIGDEYTLAVVSASELLQVLEQLEVGQRKRLELIFNEISDVREYLIRTRRKDRRAAIELQPGESLATSNVDDSGSANQRNELRKLFAQRAILQIDKSAKEIIGVAESFEDIRLQLINNRVDSEDRKIRLAKKIVQPLRDLPVGVMAELRRVVVELESLIVPVMDESINENSAALSDSAIQLTDKTLIQLDEVLSILVKYETQNELLDIVRRMIAEQGELLEETKKLRQREAFDDLFE